MTVRIPTLWNQQLTEDKGFKRERENTRKGHPVVVPDTRRLLAMKNENNARDDMMTREFAQPVHRLGKMKSTWVNLFDSCDDRRSQFGPMAENRKWTADILKNLRDDVYEIRVEWEWLDDLRFHETKGETNEVGGGGGGNIQHVGCTHPPRAFIILFNTSFCRLQFYNNHNERNFTKQRRSCALWRQWLEPANGHQSLIN